MRCYNCNNELFDSEVCSHCECDNNIIFELIELSSICYNDALINISQNRITSAIKLLRSSIQINSMNIDAINLLGLCFYRIGNFEMAYKYWTLSVSKQEINNIAVEYLKEFETEDYKTKILKGLEIYNKSIDFIQENEKFAIMQLKKVVKFIPNFVAANLLLSILLIKDKEYLQAYQLLKKVLYIDCENVDALRYKSKIEKTALKRENKTEKNKNDYNLEPKNLNSISIGNRVVSIFIGFIVGICFMAVLVYPAVKINQIDTSKDIFTGKNQEIVNLKTKFEESKKQINELNNKIKELKDNLENNGKSNKNVIEAVYIVAKQKYDGNDINGAKQYANIAINLGGTSADLYILYLRTIILTDGVGAAENLVKEIETKFKDDKDIIQKVHDIIDASKE